MPKLNQKGVVHLLLPIILILGLVATVYLIGQQTNIFPKASEPKQGRLLSEPVPTPTPFTCTACIADINKDSNVNIRDFSFLSSCFNKPATGDCVRADLDQNGTVDDVDYQCVKAQFGKKCIAPTPTASPSSKRVFITSFGVNFIQGLSFHGLSGADSLCQVTADGRSLGGTWKAWLSDSQVSAASRLTHNSGTYKLLDGTTIANNWNDLIDGSLSHSINITERGTSITSAVVWTNTKVDGSIKGTSNCGDWFVNTPPGGMYNAIGDSGTAVSNPSQVINWEEKWWTDSSPANCSTSHPLYCFEQ